MLHAVEFEAVFLLQLKLHLAVSVLVLFGIMG